MSHSYVTFSVKLPSYHGESFGLTDDLAGLIFIFWEFLPEQDVIYGTVQSRVITETSMTKSSTAGTSISVGLVELIGCEGSSVKGSS